jgi:putative pyruvate formate lyase activating enzyme
MNRPAYLALAADGRLQDRADAAIARLAACTLCARRCGADRHAGIAKASCRIGRLAKIHAWSEGDIHFAGCNLRCLHCPTPAAGWDAIGAEATPERLAAIMLDVQRRGGRILVLVKPSHVAAQILEALVLAVAGGFRLPLAWRSGGYDSLDTLALLDGIVDLYLPDAKYGESAVARQCSGVSRYVETNRAIIAEMHRQVGPPQRDGDGLMFRGVQVRHQVLPNHLAGTEAALAGLPPGIAVSVTEDYRPTFRADRHAKLNRPASAEELAQARAAAARLGV